MIPLVRNLKIYHLIGIGDSKTIKIANLLDELFVGLTIILQEDGNVLYYRGDDIIMLIGYENKILSIEYDRWSIFETIYYLNYLQIQSIISYSIFKHYKINDSGYKIHYAKKLRSWCTYMKYKIEI